MRLPWPLPFGSKASMNSRTFVQSGLDEPAESSDSRLFVPDEMKEELVSLNVQYWRSLLNTGSSFSSDAAKVAALNAVGKVERAQKQLTEERTHLGEQIEYLSSQETALNRLRAKGSGVDNAWNVHAAEEFISALQVDVENSRRLVVSAELRVQTSLEEADAQLDMANMINCDLEECDKSKEKLTAARDTMKLVQSFVDELTEAKDALSAQTQELAKCQEDQLQLYSDQASELSEDSSAALWGGEAAVLASYSAELGKAQTQITQFQQQVDESAQRVKAMEGKMQEIVDEAENKLNRAGLIVYQSEERSDRPLQASTTTLLKRAKVFPLDPATQLAAAKKAVGRAQVMQEQQNKVKEALDAQTIELARTQDIALELAAAQVTEGSEFPELDAARAQVAEIEADVDKLAALFSQMEAQREQSAQNAEVQLARSNVLMFGISWSSLFFWGNVGVPSKLELMGVESS